MLHPSISRTHCILIVDADSNVQLIDPGSKAGTAIDKTPMIQNIPYLLKDRQIITFGESTRTYRVSLDFSKVTKSFELEKAKLENDLKILENLEDDNVDLETLHKSLGIKKKDTVWVGGLIPSVTEEDIRDLFED
jgi:pSer/pThr/pTyr-binding forkhead associated (FHA) protein